VSDASLQTIQWTILRPRLRSKRPITQRQHDYKNDLDFTTNVFLETMRTGQLFDPTRWHEILRRYGMENRLEPLERLSIWLGLWYSGQLKHDDSRLPTSSSPDQGSVKAYTSVPDKGGQHPLAVIFTPHLLRAIIAWGFKSEAASPESVTSIKLGSLAESANQSQEPGSDTSEITRDWTRGLALLRKLHGFGVNLKGMGLRREVKLRLWILYGPGRSTVAANRQAQKMNKFSLVHRVNQIHRIMGFNWLRLPLPIRGRSDVSHWTMYRALFGQPRRTRRRTAKDRG
jgi:hypothetical protein